MHTVPLHVHVSTHSVHIQNIINLCETVNVGKYKAN